jgi:hypothetical protein
MSYDPSRHWRGVINQQGRVTLEADWNEAAAIAAEDDRAQLVDVIGPSGTPDDGYRVLPVSGSGDLTVQHGTMYVGGERMVLETDLDHAHQPDWVDWNGDPLWVPPDTPEGTVDEAVYLLLREQEVGAVEDPALLDIALGGPDTSERARIVQRVVRGGTDHPDCAGALGDLETTWAAMGLAFDPASMRLESAASLQVSFQQPPGTATPCEPVAQGGYLGAENQLIRVQVASVDQTGVPTLVWGFDNAYFLYRIAQASPDTAGGTTTLTLASAPVDSFHQPAKGQAVEVLQAAAELTSSDYVAATTGIVTSLASAYQPDDQTLVISTALGPQATDSPLLFLRVWQDTIAASGGGPFALGDTGVQVTLNSSTGVYHVGDYWQFAVRPGTPTEVSPVYPQRILDAPQPPDGPRLWACPLAVVAWADGSPTITDCRQHFDNLVTLTGKGSGGCCTIEVSPADVGGGAKLQALIDKYARQGPTTICLQPGTYKLPAPLVINAEHAGLTIQGCETGVIIEAAQSTGATFRLGLILLERPTNFTLRGVELVLPLVRFSFARTAIAGIPAERQPLLAAYGSGLALSIGVYVLGGAGLSFEDCTFSFPPGGKGNVFGAAILGTHAIHGLEIVNCNFTATEVATVPFSQLARGAEADPPYEVRFGYLQVPTRAQKVTFRPPLTNLAVTGNETRVAQQPAPKLSKRAEAAAAADAAAAAAAATQVALPSLGDAVIERCVFDGLTVPILVLGHVGTVRIDDNIVRSCYGGFWLVTAATTNVLSMLDRVGAGNTGVFEYLVSSRLTAIADPVLLFASVLGRVLPLTPDSPDSTGAVGVIPAPHATLLTAAEGLFTRLYSLTAAAIANIAGAPATPTAGAPSAPAPPPAPAAPAGTTIASDVAGKRLFQLPSILSDAFKAPAAVATGDLVPQVDPGTALRPRLDVSRNQVDAVVAKSDSGAGLLVIALDTTDASSLVCSGNRIRSRVELGATVSLWSLVECTFTGNIVSNEIANAKNDRSLVLEPHLIGKVAAVAVTGNVLIGQAQLPPRPNAAPFDTWNGLNTIMDYVAP